MDKKTPIVIEKGATVGKHAPGTPASFVGHYLKIFVSMLVARSCTIV